MNRFTKDKGLSTIGKFHCYSSVINMLTVDVGDEVPLTIGAALLLVADTFLVCVYSSLCKKRCIQQGGNASRSYVTWTEAIT